jgi:hypothetical protein
MPNHALADQGCQIAFFQTQKSKFEKILEGLAIVDAGILHGHMVYFMAIWFILWPFGIFYGYLVYSFPFWCSVPRKIWQTCCRPDARNEKTCFMQSYI